MTGGIGVEVGAWDEEGIGGWGWVEERDIDVGGEGVGGVGRRGWDKVGV